MGRRSRWEDLPTESVHPESLTLDRLSTQAVLSLMASEDRAVVEAVGKERRRISRAAAEIAQRLASGGRLFFVGAGTSGRLGVLEAAECPPTFGTDPKQIVAIIAGGSRSVFRAKENVEDRDGEGAEALRDNQLVKDDIVVGISASSVTPFVRGALAFARKRHAATVLVTCGNRLRGVADIVVAPAVGPEVLAGSTRLKAGTATKLVLNQLTLAAMIRLGKVHGPYMVDVKPRSAKLRDRAVRIVQSIADVDRGQAQELLVRARGSVKVAVLMGRLGIDRRQAEQRLEESDGRLRKALGTSPSQG
jgi:N-acetylmuramic acid 6-phosphate etherase